MAKKVSSEKLLDYSDELIKEAKEVHLGLVKMAKAINKTMFSYVWFTQAELFSMYKCVSKELREQMVANLNTLIKSGFVDMRQTRLRGLEYKICLKAEKRKELLQQTLKQQKEYLNLIQHDFDITMIMFEQVKAGDVKDD